MANPRVAVIMLGNMRSFNITHRNLEAYLLQPYNCDLYITTYDKRFNSKYGGVTEEIISEAQIRSIYGKYLKHLTIINQDTFTEPYMRITDKQYKFAPELDRLFTIQKLSMLAYDIFIGECYRNNRIYDIIVRIRPDIMFNERLILDTTINCNQIIVPSNDSGGCFNDHFAYGKQNAMAKYFTYYRSFQDVDRVDNGKMCDVSIVESGLRKHLEFAKIDIMRRQIKYTILRDTKPQRIIFTGNKNGQFFVKKY